MLKFPGYLYHPLFWIPHPYSDGVKERIFAIVQIMSYLDGKIGFR